MNNKTKTDKLIQQIRKLSPAAARTLKDAQVDDDEALLTLTRQDLNELLSGANNFQIRRQIMELINKTLQEPTRPGVEPLLESLWGMIPKANLKGALSPGSQLHQYRQALKDKEQHLEGALGFLRCHIAVIDKLVQEERVHGGAPSPQVPNSASADPAPSTPPNEGNSVACSVDVHTLVCSNTHNIHTLFLGNLGVSMQECSMEECQVILVFCPVASRVGTDVEKAMTKLPDDKPAILVLMHHSHTPDKVVSRRLTVKDNVMLTVHCLFHEQRGLLDCILTQDAIQRVRSALLENTPKKKTHQWMH